MVLNISVNGKTIKKMGLENLSIPQKKNMKETGDKGRNKGEES